MGVILKVSVILKTIKDLKSRQTKQLLYLPGIKAHLTYEEAAELIFNEAKLIAGMEYLRELTSNHLCIVHDEVIQGSHS